MNGDHLWLETNCSGDLCYLGEETCVVKIAVSITWLNRLKRAREVRRLLYLQGELKAEERVSLERFSTDIFFHEII